MTDPTSPDESLNHQAQVVAASSRALSQAAGSVEDSADRRTVLAVDRTLLAAERTYAAWVRTGLAALASGVGARALFAKVLPGWFGGLTGSVLIVFGAFCFCAAVWRELTPGYASPAPDARRLPEAWLLGMNGFLVFVSAAALVGVWVARV
ncbi:YidH family protein [Caulobacter sp. KR2-114]|uniref:YidH family protein n=1 Tax=Caulobacter sp. KR2-114 TaxID=3400912 RepID=UPI003C0B9F34